MNLEEPRISFYLKLVGDSPNKIKEVPEELLTEAFVIQALKRNRAIYDFLPHELKTEDVSLVANAKKIKDVPKERLTEDFAIKALKLNYRIYELLPRELKTERVSLEGIALCCLIIKEVPEELLTEDFVMKALKRNILIYELLPHKLKTERVSIEAVKMAGYLIQCVPPEIQSDEMKMEAIRNWCFSIRLISNPSRSLIVKAIEGNGKVMHIIPHELLDKELCTMAVKNGGCIDNVPAKYRDEVLLDIE